MIKCIFKLRNFVLIICLFTVFSLILTSIYDFKIYAALSGVYDGWYMDFSYTGNEQYFEVPISGEYLMEVWGAQGGATRGGSGGMGGYSYGKVFLKAGDKIYVQVGGNGLNHYGYNGGGIGEIENADAYCYGGGATHIALSSGMLEELENNQSDIFIVAGGGGGGERTGICGGSGGGGNNNGTDGGAWEGYNDEEYFNYTEKTAKGGTQTSGGEYGNNYDNWNKSKGMSGVFGRGGDAYDNEYALLNGYMESGFRDYGGGGGGGWYGGGGIEWAGGGGGGSGHIGNSLYEYGGENGVQSGDGFARITFIKAAEYSVTVKYMKYNPNSYLWEIYDTKLYEHLLYGSSFDVPDGNCPEGHHLDHKDKSSITVTEDTSVCVYYYPNTYTITFNSNGGECDKTTRQILYGETIGSLPSAVRNGCEFCGWFFETKLFINSNDINSSQKLTENTAYTYTNNIVVYAGWLDTASPDVSVTAGDDNSLNYENTWKNKALNINIKINDIGFAGIDKVIVTNTNSNSEFFSKSYSSGVMQDSINVIIGNSQKMLYEGEIKWKITASDKAGNKSESYFTTKLDYTPPVITDINGEYDTQGNPVSATVYQYYNEDNLICQKASDDKTSVNAVSGVESLSVYLTSGPGVFISSLLTPKIKTAPYVLQYDFNNLDENEYAVLLCARDKAGNESYRLVITKAGFNRMFKRTLPKENYT